MEIENSLEWPLFGEEEEEAVLRVIRSNQLFAANEVRSFEEQYSDFIGVDFSIGVGNATQGLHLALAALEIGVGDEVIVTPYSWISSASCTLMQNSVPIFCDIEDKTFGLDPKQVEKLITKRTKAVVCVHMFGYPCRAIELKEVCKENNLHLIEDNSHAHGAKIRNNYTGTIGSISVASLHQRKSLCVGDGGIVCTNNRELRDKIYRLRSFGDKELSYNYRMTEFAAAIGKVRLAKLNHHNAKRISNARLLEKIFEDNNFVKVLKAEKDTQSVYYAVLLVLNRSLDLEFEQLPYCNNPKTAIVRWTWEPLHKNSNFDINNIPARGYPWEFEHYKNEKRWNVPKLKIAEKYLNKRIIEFYVHPTFDKDKIKTIGEQLNLQIKRKAISV